ncbi:DUF1611 domain-containing protein [Candidatus Kaiserbacteria bacterium]|nr:DUF1611 domain-containing protein [Candidatus Kaiserbacteria bacterium]
MKMREFPVQEKRSALQQVEAALGQPLFKGEVTDSFLENSTEYFRKWHKPRLRVALETLHLLKESQGGDASPGVQQRLRTLRDVMRAGQDVEPHTKIEIAGHQIKVVSSNIRRNDLSWEGLSLVETGVGHEGDVALAEVVDPTGSTKKIENIYGRDEGLVKGDKVLVVFGHRHTGTSEYGGIPGDGWDLNAEREVDLLAHGGIVGKAESIPARMGQRATKLRVLGLLAKGDTPLNLRDLFPPWENALNSSAPIIAFCGTGAEVGKTTTASALIRELKSRGLKVAATKVAGTGRYRDLLALRDAGADTFHDFPEVGLPSTYTTPERYIPAIKTLINKLNEDEPDIIVAEFGGDIIEANIPSFFQDAELRSAVKAIIHSSGDIMGMEGSLEHYREWGLSSVPTFLTQPKERNPLGTETRVKEHIGLPLFDSLNTAQVSDVVTQIETAILQQEADRKA